MCEVELLLHDERPKLPFHSTTYLKEMCEIIEKVSLKHMYLVVLVEDPHHLCHPIFHPSFYNQCFHDYIFLLIEKIVMFLST